MGSRFKWPVCGKAEDGNIVSGANFRFTVLTERLIRMEYSESGVFEDRASKSFFYRNFPQSEFSAMRQNGVTVIETPYLVLKYTGGVFSADSLRIRLKNFPGAEWRFGDKTDQLMGTASTLDLSDGEIPLQEGVCSRNGYVVTDDSDSPLLSDDGWFALRNEGASDLYFFGYGHNYLDCIKDYYRLTGAPPLLPDYALGNWWSRYYDYTQKEYCELMERFEREDIPFSVAVVDMGWHTQEDIEENRIDNERYIPGWTGYTWNKKLFPDYKEFLKFLKEHNLKTALNLHPAQGVGCNEEMYEEMAKACGIDPKTKKLVKFDCLNEKFMENYFDILHHPYERDGVDFWWMDWQQGTDYWWVHDEDHPADPLEKTDPLWLLNHLHITDISRNGKRPMFFSRYCGLGAHRYPVGFSGDTVVTWESLRFQPYFTANASNAGYSWWSHDIGGHMYGYRDDEMVVRWMQLGVFSPINRLHSAINPFTGKEPWNLHPYLCGIAKKWLRARHMLFPYIYTMNYRNHTDLIPMILPMYYPYPEKENAYKCPRQFMFGSELMISPITEKADARALLAPTEVWFPEGIWIDAFNGFIYKGEEKTRVYRGIEDFPVFGKAGAIVPMQCNTGNNRLGRQKNMQLCVFAGADNDFTLYEDAGDYDNYKNGEYVLTEFCFKWSDNTASLSISPARGDIKLLPESRNWSIRLTGVKQPSGAAAVINGKRTAIDFEYDGKRAAATLKLNDIPTDCAVTVEFESETALLNDNSNAKDRIFDILLHSQVSYAVKTDIWNYLNGKSRWDERLFMHCGEAEHEALKQSIAEMQRLTAK